MGMAHLNITDLSILFTVCVSMFLVLLKINTDCLYARVYPYGLYNGGNVCLL